MFSACAKLLALQGEITCCSVGAYPFHNFLDRVELFFQVRSIVQQFFEIDLYNLRECCSLFMPAAAFLGSHAQAGVPSL